MQTYASVTSAVLSALVVAAFVFLCLVVIAYTPVVGWVALGFTAAFALVVLAGVLHQAPWPWRDSTFEPPNAVERANGAASKVGSVRHRSGVGDSSTASHYMT